MLFCLVIDHKYLNKVTPLFIMTNPRTVVIDSLKAYYIYIDEFWGS
jgi:hypothetical protein